MKTINVAEIGFDPRHLPEDCKELIAIYKTIRKIGPEKRVRIKPLNNTYDFCDVLEKYFYDDRLDVIARSIKILREKNPYSTEFILERI